MRIELIEFLLAHEERARALSELLALTASLPDDAGVQTQAGRMFLAAGDPRLALEHFVRAIRLDSANADALAGAGEAAFELTDYSRALSYLNAAPQGDARVTELREVARLVLLSDPLAPRLGVSERRRRLWAGLRQTVPRLETCSSDPSAQSTANLEPLRKEAQAFVANLKLPRRQDARDIVDRGVDLVYRIERAVAQHCQLPPAPLDRALLLIGRRHGFGEP